MPLRLSLHRSLPLLFVLFAGSPLHAFSDIDSEPHVTVVQPTFKEIWAYVLAGEESYLAPSYQISDVAYFGANLNSYGELVAIPNVAKLKSFQGRKHLVLAVLDNQALTHMAVFPEFAVRAKLIDDLMKAIEPFDGLQLDFESVTSRDKENFWSFLKDLKLRMGNKTLSVAVPARTKFIDDAYNYQILDQICDRVIIMAYDEHWSGSEAGPVSSMAWGRRVAEYSLGVIRPSKLVMGAPFYGRAWTDKSLARAYRSSGISQLLESQGISQLNRVEGIPSFEYDERVRVRVFFEDRESHAARLTQYMSLGIKNAAFWRLGQEEPGFWSGLQLTPGS